MRCTLGGELIHDFLMDESVWHVRTDLERVEADPIIDFGTVSACPKLKWMVDDFQVQC